MTRVDLHVTKDGMAIPGFPYTREQQFRQVINYWDKLTQIVTFSSAIPVFAPNTTQYMGLFIIRTDKDLSVAVKDTEGSNPDVPFTLPAGRGFALIGGIMLHTSSDPLVRIRAAATNTTVQVTIGVL